MILPPTLTVHFNDFIQAGEDGGQLDAGQELLSLQRLGEDHLEDTQHPHVSVLGGEQLWEGTKNRTGFKAQLSRRVRPNCLRTIDDFLPLSLLLAETSQGFGGGQLSPVGRVLLKLQEAWLHLLQLWRRACRGMTLAFRI